MKNLTNLFLLFLLSNIAAAQLDTILFENFQVDPFPTMISSSSGSDTSWVNFDEDGLATAFGTEASKRWFWDEFFTDPFDSITGVNNYIGASLSFLDGGALGNRNWLILPPVEVQDDSYMLHWQSAPNQMPRYMDGYVVLTSSSGNNTDTDFNDTLFVAASMESFTGDGQNTDFSNFTFTSGYVHADGGTLTDYVADAGGTILRGLLEPHSVSLQNYVGETIYIAFLHNSDDDEQLGLDDILITRSMVSNTNEIAHKDFRLECYPVPANHRMNFNFNLEKKSSVSYKILDAKGQLMQSRYLGELTRGAHSQMLQIDELPSGVYLLNLQVGASVVAEQFVKR